MRRIQALELEDHEWFLILRICVAAFHSKPVSLHLIYFGLQKRVEGPLGKILQLLLKNLSDQSWLQKIELGLAKLELSYHFFLSA